MREKLLFRNAPAGSRVDHREAECSPLNLAGGVSGVGQGFCVEGMREDELGERALARVRQAVAEFVIEGSPIEPGLIFQRRDDGQDGDTDFGEFIR